MIRILTESECKRLTRKPTQIDECPPVRGASRPLKDTRSEDPSDSCPECGGSGIGLDDDGFEDACRRC